MSTGTPPGGGYDPSQSGGYLGGGQSPPAGGWPGQPGYGSVPGGQPPRRRRRHKFRNIFGGIVGLIVLIVIIVSVATSGGSGSGGTGSGGSGSAATVATAGGSCIQSGLTADAGALTCGTNGKWQVTGSGSSSSSSVSSQAPAAPTYTPAQQQAIDAAENYLTDGTGFSRKGLIQQLHSHYGNGFSKKLAVFAVDHVSVNWDHQAEICAKNYLNDGEGFSYAGLVQQLESPYGNDFTYAQAAYGAKKAGL